MRGIQMKSFLLKTVFAAVAMGSVMSVYADENTPILQQIQGNTQNVAASISQQTGFLQSMASYEQQIASYTQQTLNNLNTNMVNFNNYMPQIAQFIVSWMAPDTSQIAQSAQTSFTQLNTLLNTDITNQLALQPQLNTALIGSDATTKSLPWANDLTYSTVLGSPIFSPDPRNVAGKTPVNAVFNYAKNASGINLTHAAPGLDWQGSGASQTRYINYYNTVTAAQSFGGYVMSNQYADGNQLTSFQQGLLQQINDTSSPTSSWYVQIASENLGSVLRQILLFESQNFVLMTQLLQTERQMVTAQVMTNAILVANNSLNEASMVAYAKGIQPQL